MKATIVAQINAQHRLAKDFNKKLDEMMVWRSCVVEQLKSEAEAAYAMITMEFTHEVVSATREPYLPDQVREADPVRVVRKWINKALYDQLAVLFGVQRGGNETTTISVVYYRVGDVLVATGQGKQILKSNVKCSSDQWARIKESQVEEEFFNKAA